MSPKKKNQPKNDYREDMGAERSESYVSFYENGDNNSEASYDSTSSNPSPCGQCKKLVKEEDSAMKCEICEQWYHINVKTSPRLNTTISKEEEHQKRE